MKIKKDYTGIIKFLLSASLVLILAILFWILWNDYYRKMVIDPFYEKGALLLTFLYIIIYFLLTKIYGAFKVGYLKVVDIIYSQSLSIAFTNVFIYMQFSLLAKKLVSPIALIIITIIDIIFMIIWVFITNKVYFSLNPPTNMLVIYKNESVVSLMTKLRDHKEKYIISSAINIDKGLETVKSEIDNYETVIMCDLDTSDRNKLIKYCFKKSIRIYLTPKISDIIIQSSDKLHIFDTPLLLCKNKGLTYEQKLLKRTSDLVVSLLGILLLSPIMILIAFFVKINDGGPIIFKQRRLTLNNKVFEIYKFRSMVVNAEKEGEARLASQHDNRITLVGKVLRATRLDELPQLFNILKGDMSVVGPRPERPEIASQYIDIMPEFEFRTKVKAGLTGYAQTFGKYNTTPYDKLKLDLMYIGNYSIFMDIKIMFMTIKVLFIPESSEGIEDGEMLPELIAYEKNN